MIYANLNAPNAQVQFKKRYDNYINGGWTNCYQAYPIHAALGGYKQFGLGWENHKMMLSHYQKMKNLLVSYSPDALGFL
mgnify:FL=1